MPSCTALQRAVQGFTARPAGQSGKRILPGPRYNNTRLLFPCTAVESFSHSPHGATVGSFILEPPRQKCREACPTVDVFKEPWSWLALPTPDVAEK